VDYAVVGGLALLETAALVGLLAPGEWSVIIGGAVAAGGAVGVVGLIVAVWVCAAAGHGLSFLAGRRFGRAFLVRHGPRFRLGPERLSRVDRFLARHGAKAVLGGQFIGLVRAVVPFLAGASGMPYRRFAAPSIVATGTWAVAFTLLGYFSYRSLAEVEGTVGVAAGAGTVLAALAAGAAWIRHRRRRRRGAPEGLPAVQSLTLTDGSTVDVRPMEVGDRAELAAAFARLGSESRRRRFDSPKPRLDDRELTFLIDVDHHRHEALVAIEPITARGVAVARYVAGAHDPAVAEVAVTVDDRWQGRGLGTSLSRLLLERAADEGLDRLRATVGGDNARALALARRIGYGVSSVASGSVVLEHRRSGRVPPAGWR
jgi:membrane protein DedA with SNARE-associated domain/RimJ/RimL family protein N-acetyltransferase